MTALLEFQRTLARAVMRPLEFARQHEARRAKTASRW